MTDLQDWITLIEAEFHVREVRISSQRAHTELFDALKSGEIPARAKKFRWGLDWRSMTELPDNEINQHLWDLVSYIPGCYNFTKHKQWNGDILTSHLFEFSDVWVWRPDVYRLWPSTGSAKSDLPKRSPSRPPKRSLESADEPLVQQMHDLILSREAASPTEAAWSVIGRDGSGARGSGQPESKVSRLVSRHRQLYGA